MRDSRSEHIPLGDGARIGIIGGGPAGSLFAHFALRYARERGIDLDVHIFDGKSFATSGAKGCNMCAGVIARSFANHLKEEGIELPPNVIQRNVEGYWLETPAGGVCLRHELEPGGICTVYRGNGPRGSSFRGNISFDDYLLETVKQRGVKVIPHYATDIELPKGADGRVRVVYGRGPDAASEEFDLVVGAFGLNSRMASRAMELGFGYAPPASLRGIQAEVFLGEERIRQAFGNYIYVYALRLPGVKFAAITPKFEYLTVTIVGDGVGEKDVIALLNHPRIRDRFPEDVRLQSVHCQCQPRVAISASRRPFADRLVIIGDASDSRLYKNGLESSFFTARAAAETAIRYGVCASAFKEHYYPTCEGIVRDSFYGKIIFFVDQLIFSHNLSTKLLLNAARLEQQRYSWKEQLINELLWNILTGNRPYREILLKGLSPRLHVRTAVKTIKSFWRKLTTNET